MTSIDLTEKIRRRRAEKVREQRAREGTVGKAVDTSKLKPVNPPAR